MQNVWTSESNGPGELKLMAIRESAKNLFISTWNYRENLREKYLHDAHFVQNVKHDV